MDAITYDRVFDYWLRNRRITIRLLDASSHISVFAFSAPHTAEYRLELQHALDSAEIFQVGSGRPMNRAFFDALLRGLTCNALAPNCRGLSCPNALRSCQRAVR